MRRHYTGILVLLVLVLTIDGERRDREALVSRGLQELVGVADDAEPAAEQRLRISTTAPCQQATTDESGDLRMGRTANLAVCSAPNTARTKSGFTAAVEATTWRVATGLACGRKTGWLDLGGCAALVGACWIQNCMGEAVSSARLGTIELIVSAAKVKAARTALLVLMAPPRGRGSQAILADRGGRVSPGLPRCWVWRVRRSARSL